MIADSLRSVLRTVHSRFSSEPEELKFSVDQVVDQIYRGLFDREADPAGREAFRNFLSDGLRQGDPSVAQMLRACIESPEFRLRYTSESRAPIGISASDAEQVFNRFQKYDGPGHSGHVTNFLGAITNVAFSSGIEMLDGQVEDLPVSGNFHSGAME